MADDLFGVELAALTERWWVPIVRGAAAVLFGLVTLIAPSMGLLALIVLWGAYAMIDGMLNLVLAFRAVEGGRRWGWFLFEAMASIGFGALVFVYPGTTAMVLLMMIAAWALLTGVVEIAAAVHLRRLVRGEWLLALSGIVSVSLGVLLFAFPGPGALALAWLIGLGVLAFGLLLVGLGRRLHRLHRDALAASPPDGMPTFG